MIRYNNMHPNAFKTSYDVLNQDIEKEYEAAINYYSQRRQAFVNFLKNKNKNDFKEDDLKQKIEDTILKKYKKITDNIIDKNNQKTGMFISNENKHLIENPNYFKNLLGDGEIDELDFWALNEIRNRVTSLKTSNNNNTYSSKNILSEVGKVFEVYIAKILEKDNWFQTFIDVNAEKIIIEAMGMTKQSKSAVTAKAENTRTDILISSSISYQDENKVLKVGDDKPINIELQNFIDTSEFNVLNSDTGVSTPSELMNEYLNAEAFGLSVKLYDWKRANGQKFSSSSVIRKGLNEEFEQYGRKIDRTWETNYATAFMAYYLAKNIISIINPVNVAFISGSEFIWMDDFLRSKRFYMNLSIDKAATQYHGGIQKSRRTSPDGLQAGLAGGYEMFPHAIEDTIRIRNIGNAKKAILTSAFSTKTNKMTIRKKVLIK